MLVERSKLERVMGERLKNSSTNPTSMVMGERAKNTSSNSASIMMGERAENTSTNSASSNISPVKRPNTRSSRMLENNSKATIKLVDEEDQPEEITLDGEPVFEDEKVKVGSKRKSQDGFLPSRRLRSRG